MTNQLSIGLTPKRIDVADVLRGIAVMGIVILHSVEHFNLFSYPDTAGQGALLNFTDKAIWDSLFFLFGGKAYGIFALLFGFSFFIQENNQRLKGNDFRGRFMWRLLLLFIIGNVNAAFFTAEILVMYSLIGFVLVACCRLPDKAVFWIALILLLQPVDWGKFIYALANPEVTPAAGLSGYYFREVLEVQVNGNFWQTVKINLWEGQLASLTWAWEHGRIFQTAALFLFGMLVGRKEWFTGTEKNLRGWFAALCWGLAGFFVLTGLNALLSGMIDNPAAVQSLSRILTSLAKFSFMVVLIAVIITVFYTTSWQKPLMKLAPYGRMSLTNYLTQSIIGSMLFYNWGFGLHQYLGITASFFVGIALFLAQWFFCRWWLSRHSHGPFEYVWKKATWIGAKK